MTTSDIFDLRYLDDFELLPPDDALFSGGVREIGEPDVVGLQDAGYAVVWSADEFANCSRGELKTI